MNFLKAFALALSIFASLPGNIAAAPDDPPRLRREGVARLWTGTALRLARRTDGHRGIPPDPHRSGRVLGPTIGRVGSGE